MVNSSPQIQPLKNAYHIADNSHEMPSFILSEKKKEKKPKKTSSNAFVFQA